MSLFKNEGLDYIDYTLLKKKGILKIKDNNNDIGVIDLTQISSPPSSLQTSQSSGSGFGSFFGSADASPPSSPSSSTSYFDNSPSSSTSSAQSSSSSNSDLSALKIKLEDFEYKIEKLLERLSKIESRLPIS